MAMRSARHVYFALLLPIAIALPTLFWQPAPVGASTESSMSDTILSLINQDRAAAGLIALRVDSRLAGLAMNRADWMASADTISHDSYGGAVNDAIAMVGVSAYSSGEAVGSTNATVGTAAATFIYNLWRGSPEHWALITSDMFNYIGVGVGYRDASGETFSSLVFAEAPDSSRPMVRMTSSGRNLRTVYFMWMGRDGQLQTHTAGLRDFDVQYRVDYGTWVTIRTHITSTQLILANRPAGHAYSVRVRDRDRRNNLSLWSAARTVRV